MSEKPAPELPPEEAVYHLAGDRLGKFVIIHELGRGSMGVVYEAFQEDLKRKVALKILPANIALNAKQVRRFRREAESMARLQHDHIIPIHEVGVLENTHYFAMKVVEGSPFGEQLGRDRDSIRKAAALAAQAARGLAHAHAQGVVHRDIKPGNLLVDREGKVVITDFGLARLTDSGSLTSTDAIVGTPKYMSPEQILPGTRTVDGRTDIYALGATLYEVCTGRAPFEEPSVQAYIRAILETRPPTPRRFNRQIPHDLATIILRCLEKEPSDRYAAADELADDLERFLAGERIHARPRGTLAIAFDKVRRHKLISALVLLAVVALLLVLVLGGELEREREENRLNQQLALIQAQDDVDVAVQEIEELAARYPADPTVEQVLRRTYLRHAETRLAEADPSFDTVLEDLRQAGLHGGFWHMMALVEARRFEEARTEAERLPRGGTLRNLALARLAAEDGRWQEAVDLIELKQPDADDPIQCAVYQKLVLGEAYLGLSQVSEIPDPQRRARLELARARLSEANEVAQAIPERWLRTRIQLLLFECLDRLNQTVDPKVVILDGAAAIQETLRALTRWWASMTPREAAIAQEYLDRVLVLANLQGKPAAELERQAQALLKVADPGRDRVVANLVLAVASLSRGRLEQARAAMEAAEDALYDTDQAASLEPYVAWGRSIVFRAEEDLAESINWSIQALRRALSSTDAFPDLETLARHALLLGEEASRRELTDDARRTGEFLLKELSADPSGGTPAWLSDLLARVRTLAELRAAPK